MSTHPLDCLEPSDQPLLNLIVEHIDDAMLLEIARCDYGDDVEIHLAALHQIRAKNIPTPLEWYPGEVLNLTSWTKLNSLKSQDGGISTRSHWMRLFACTVLIWASLEPENDKDPDEYWYYIDGEQSTIIQFLDSALYLGDDVSIAALRFLGWRMQSQIKRALIDEDFGHCPCYAVAMLLLCASLDRGDPEIVSFLISIAYCNHEYIPIFKEINDCQLSQEWRDTIHRIFLDPTAPDNTRSGKDDAVHNNKLSPTQSNPELQHLVMELMGSSSKIAGIVNDNLRQSFQGEV
jgi:hypothetical protein